MRIRAAVVVASDSRSAGEREEKVGPAARKSLGDLEIDVIEVVVVPDEMDAIEETLKTLALRGEVSLILTSGGTGLAPRDVTPEATKRVIDREAPGIAEMLRQKSLAVTPRAALSRGVAGILNRTLIVNLPGSPKAVAESIGFLAPILPHAIETLLGNAVECAKSS